MKIYLAVLLSLLILSCQRKKVDSNDHALDVLVQSSYDYYLKSTHNQNIQKSYIRKVEDLRDYAEKAIDNKNDVKYYNDFERLALEILDKYGSVELSGNNNLLRNSINSSINTKVKLLEYIVVNTMIRYYHQPIYEMNYFDIIVSPNNPLIGLNESFSSNIYLAFNNTYNRVALVVKGDTIRSGPGAAITYNYPTEQKGKFSTQAEIVITHRGEKESIPFVINYEVK